MKAKAEIEAELSQFRGLPKCQDCGWKFGSPITTNCPCRGPENIDISKYNKAFARAREIQRLLRNED